MRVIEKFVPILIKSGNQLGGSFWVKHNYTKKIQKDLLWFFHDYEKPKDIKEKHVSVSMTVVVGKGHKKFDEDNMAWGLKAVFDGLKHMGFIYEDSPKWITRHYYCVRSTEVEGMKPEDYGVKIKIEYEHE